MSKGKAVVVEQLVNNCRIITEYKNYIDKKKVIEYCNLVSLIQSGGVIRDYEATATPEM